MPPSKYIAKGNLGRNQFSGKPRRQPIYPIGPSIAYIPLTQEQFALVDRDKAEYLCQWNWCAWWGESTQCFYAHRHWNVGGKKFSGSMHRELLRGHTSVDHIISGNGLDNRMANLRPATIQEQARNRRVRSDSASGLRGVNVKGGKWRANISLGSKRIHLGSFSTKEEAYSAYCEAARKYHGEFARVA